MITPMTPTDHHYHAHITQNLGDIRTAQELRRHCFARDAVFPDRDEYDETYQHVLIYDAAKTLVCTFRFLHLPSGGGVTQTYSGAFYDLSSLQRMNEPMIEIGRFCVHPDHADPTILRFAWSVLTQYVDQHDITLLFGCSSFNGTQTAPLADAFALLKHRYLAPKSLMPHPKADHIHPFGTMPMHPDFDLKTATKTLPTLLRTYLAMGGRVSDHAVIDHDLKTTHVFTVVEIKNIPSARKRWLRAGI